MARAAVHPHPKPRASIRWGRKVTVGLVSAGLMAGVSVLSATPASAATAHNPVGRLESVSWQKRVLTVSGWAYDPDQTASVRVAISVDGRRVMWVTAHGARPDLQTLALTHDAHRGFAGTLPATPGSHRVCATAANLGPGKSVTLGCKIIKVGPATAAPVGALDSIATTSQGFRVAGWAADPDNAESDVVSLTVNGTRLTRVLANAPRLDVGRKYPALGNNRGLDVSIMIQAGAGNYQVCATALNLSVGSDTLLGCRIVTIRPSSVPSTLGTDTAVAAATAVQMQAIASGAATAAAFARSTSSAATLAIATRALLQQAVGRTAAPLASAAHPFTIATTAAPVDEQAVMGATPALGSFPAAKKGGRAGASRALESFANDALTPPGGAGDGLVGAAPVLAANGTTVRPVLPGFAAGYHATRAEVAVSAALAELGQPYVWAAAGPASFDCSGLTQWAWAQAGVNLTHYTGAQAVQGHRVQPNQLLPGDLVLFGADLHHVGMYIGAGYMIDAPYTGAYVRLDKISWFGDFTLAVRP